MDDFPIEIIDCISSFLDQNTLKRTLFVSRAFQASAEYHSGAFRNFIIKSPFQQSSRFRQRLKGDDEKDVFTKFLDTYNGHRFRYLRYVEVHTAFPTLKYLEEDPDDFPCRESPEELMEKDEIFTKQIDRVFQTLKFVDSRQSKGQIELCIVTPVQWVDADFCHHRVSSAWRVHLLSPSRLPQLDCVRSLTICNPQDSEYINSGKFDEEDFRYDSRLDWRVLLDVASRCPNLEYLGCQTGSREETVSPENREKWHFERDYDACIAATRKDFAAAAQELTLPASLKNVQLDFLNPLWKHIAEQRGAGPEFIDPLQYDPFSTSLRTLATNLRRVDLRVMADQTLFCGQSSITYWPNLEFLNTTFHLRTPSGSWYFRGPDGQGESDIGYAITDTMRPPFSDDNDEDIRWHDERRQEFAPSDSYVPMTTFRAVPNDHVITPFLSAFAKAASEMHALRAAVLWAPINHRAWGLAYTIPNEIRPLDVSSGIPHSSFRQIWWSVGGWRPKPSLHRLLQGIGATMHGEELHEYWGSEESDEGMLLGRVFEQSFAAFPRRDGPGPRDHLVKDWYSRTMS
ncbi:uncharacterized protein N0V89_004576 [Didymosphaeria variabile]|uniref:F-box domain-containing protein n=1 Tax=Didymosphaeria variabile TaxID=1932322 RepID=A0A9W8XQM6_9PLEO|nr:uncharacterized protein N0V89_004576 [Didymosphaeria variabile]KAJ4356542.1 hypothetical protein N0V89_004576 [Didymosphaeria variabile]